MNPDDYNPFAPWNQEELPEVELTEMEQLQEDYFDLKMEYNRLKQKYENIIRQIEA